MHRSSAPVAALLLAVNLLALVGSVGAFVTSAALTQQTPPPSPSRTSLASAPAETDDSPALTTTADQGDEDGGNGNLSPFLKDLVVERRGFELNLGKAMDVLRKDYPYMLRESPGAYGPRDPLHPSCIPQKSYSPRLGFLIVSVSCNSFLAVFSLSFLFVTRHTTQTSPSTAMTYRSSTPRAYNSTASAATAPPSNFFGPSSPYSSTSIGPSFNPA